MLKNNQKFITIALMSSCVSALAGYFIFTNSGVPSRVPQAAMTYAKGSYDRGEACAKFRLTSFTSKGFCRLGDVENNQPKVVVWGDSHSFHLRKLMEVLSSAYNIEIWAGDSGCR